MEAIYYILQALTEPAHGYVLMQRVKELSNGQVRLAAGTLYEAIKNLLSKGFIAPIPSGDTGRKIYALTRAGREILWKDYQRMSHMLRITEHVLEKEGELK